MVKAHLVTVLGREIPVRSSASEEKVREVEAFVHTRIEAIRERLTTADPQLLVTLALLNLSEAYMDLQGRQNSAHTLENRIATMLEQVDNVLQRQG
ncbi:MAG: cell division protein ZapA [Geobacter sp.]|nr:cell division protein ZapA [Geobacter sp.]